MKRLNLILVIFLFLFLFIGCGENKQPADDFITVDVTVSYPHKKLILQDFMDVEYVPLETTDEFLCQGNVWAASEEFVIATNFNITGDIFIFDRNGKALKKINHKGQSGEEYTLFTRILLDEDDDEIYVNDQYAKKILVYDLDGNFKRRILMEGDLLFYEIYNFDRDNLICRDDFHESVGQLFMLISKDDGHIIKKIQIPFKDKKTPRIWSQDKKMTYFPQNSHPIMPYFNDYILTEYSADTLYRYSSDHTIRPFIARTPSIQSMTPEKFLLPSLLTDQYYFMEVLEKELPFSSTNLVYDKQEKALFRYKVYNSDYTNDKEVFLKSRPLNGEIPSCQYLEADELVQDYKKGRLKGKLKEIAAKLDSEDNPVIMLIKHKK